MDYDNNDPRKEYIVNLIADSFVGATGSADLRSTIRQSVLPRNELARFIDDGNCCTLQASLVKSEDGGSTQVEITNNLSFAPNCLKEIHFVKSRPEPISKLEDMQTMISVSSMMNSPTFSLYNIIHNVYAPLLLKDPNWSEKLDPKIQTLLTELESGLGTLVRRGSAIDNQAAASKFNSSENNEDNISGILTPEDEFQFWAERAEQHGGNLSSAEIERASVLSSKFDQLQLKLENLKEKSMDEMLEIIEIIDATLTDVWRAGEISSALNNRPYPQKRMANLLSVLAGTVCRFIQEKLGKYDLWNAPFSEVKKRLEQGIEICDKWLNITNEATTLQWTDESHPWVGPPHVDESVFQLGKRLEEVLRIRSSHEQVLQYLSEDEIQELRVRPSECFAPFASLQPLHYNPFTQHLWKRSVKEYENIMHPVEQRIASKLRTKLSECASQPHMMLYEFQRNSELIRRPDISKALSQERDTLLAQISSHINTLRDEFESVASSVDQQSIAGRNTPSVVNKVLWARQIKNKVEQTRNASKAILGDLPKFGDLIRTCEVLLNDLKEFEDASFRRWTKEIAEGIEGGSKLRMKGTDDDEPITLQMTGSLMDLGKEDGKLMVHYSERLVGLLREVRQLSSIGFNIPSKILQVAQTAEKFYRHGVVLKQIANFYNTLLDTQIIPSQRPMLIDVAQAFEKVVRSKGDAKKITWSNLSEAEEYIGRLQTAAEKLTSENRKLRKYHNLLCDKVSALMSINLLREEGKWVESVQDMNKEIFDRLERQGYKNMEGWKWHWDSQLYKALEHQYQLGLESLNENLPEMKVELVFKQNMIQFNPPHEKIRENYYRQMKEFITFPTRFRGFANSDIFKQIPERNARGLIVVYKKAESLMKRVQDVVKDFKDYVIFGTVDLEEIVAENLCEVPEWEANFKMLKAKGMQIEKEWKNFIKVDCITISTLQLRATVEGHLQHLGDILVSSLKKSAQGHLNIIEEFLNRAMEKLSQRPKSVEEIGQANLLYRTLNTEKSEVYKEFSKFDLKNKLLRSVAGAGIDSSPQHTKWDHFEDSILAHERMIEEQTDSLKKSLEAQVSGFFNEVSKFAARWDEFKPKQVNLGNKQDGQKALVFLKEQREELDEFKKNAEALLKECQYFDIVVTPKFEELEQVEADVQRFEAMWGVYAAYSQELEQLSQEDWISFRSKTYRFQDFISAWIERLKKEDTNNLTIYIRNELDSFRNFAPLMKYLIGEGMTVDHWSQLFRLVGIEKGMTLDKLLFGHWLEKKDVIVSSASEIKDLYARAQGEIQIRDALQDLKVWGSDAVFVLTEHNQNGRKVPLIKEWKDLVTQVGDNQCLLQSLKDSPYFGPFVDEANSWETKLSLLDEYLQNLNLIQRKWVYLEPIFGRGALPAEQQRFSRVDKEFVTIMTDIESDPRVVSLAKPHLKEKLKSILEQLDRCQRALNEFLEEKRSRFPRFYFIGDDDLLEILGQAQNPAIIQNHLKKLFGGIHSVKFGGTGSEQIVAMCSLHGEVVPLENPVTITEKVEDWLSQLDNEMRNTLVTLLYRCIASNETNIAAYPSQILCLAEYVHFTQMCEKAIQQKSLDALLKHLRRQLQQQTAFDAEGDIVLELKMKSLIFDLIHNIDVVELLIANNTTSLNDWLWRKQLRFYLDQTDGKQGCIVQMCDARFAYTFEYQGNAPRLVHTPLTDKCYLTLTQGMHLGYGGNPYGPAGTGKTESVKALGQAFGRQVLVFNCDEGIDFKSMGRIFIGLVKCGAWGCFDEFNRLKEDQLSAISQQIQIIQAAIKSKSPSIELLGKEVEVNPNAGIFVTLNPAGKGYGGRSKLPDNLKQLFRSVAMSVPNNEQIAEVILFSEGFECARELGRKVVSVFTLSKQLLSPQQHYDWGLRPLKTILTLGGQLIHAEKSKLLANSNDGAVASLTPELEAQLMIKSLRVNTISKLTFDDAKRFNGIIRDVFPGVDAPDISYEEVETAIRTALREFKLEALDTQINKVLQFYEATKQRMGVVIVGPSGSGKSTVWKVLAAALNSIGKTVKSYLMNPKSIPRDQLLGHMDMNTREWFDGVLTASARKVVKEPQEVQSWIICDGDIDPEWIESLNSVLDDNHLLTMPNGERIQFGPNVNFIFETHNLKFASPATVSRMGMIFLSEEDVDTKSIVQTWLARKQEEEGAAEVDNGRLQNWIDDYFYKALDKLMKRKESFVVETTKMGLIMSGLSHLRNVATKGEFIVGLVRGLGNYLEIDARTTFAREIFQLANERPADERRILDCYFSRDHGAYALYEYDPSASYIGSVEDLYKTPAIQTVDVIRNASNFEPWLDQMEPFLLVGPEGCGKSMILQHCFNSLKSTQVAVIHCNAQTNASHVIQKLTQVCSVFNTNQGRVYRPKEGDRMILYLKDLNLPKPDKYGTTQLISFLQQLINHQGFYDDALEWVGIDKIQIVASMTPAGTIGRHPLTSRFTAIVRVCYLSYPDREQLKRVYTEYLKVALSRDFNAHQVWSTSKNIAVLAEAMVELYEQLKKKFSVDDHAHYQFTPRDLTRWVLGMLQYDIQNGGNVNLLDIWCHEAQRLFRDRLVNEDSRQHFDSVLKSILSSKFDRHDPSFLSEFAFTTLASTASAASTPGQRPLKLLAPMKKTDFNTLVLQNLQHYEREIRELNMFVFTEVLDYIARVDRVLSQDSGSLLLAGRTGVGRRNVVALVCHMLRMELYSPNMTRDYNLKSFKNDLKTVIQKAAQGEPVCFLLEDHQLIDPVFLEYVNSLLSAGEIPGLYAPEELEQLLSPLKEQSSQEGFFGSLYSFFVSRVVKNLHIVLIMDPSNKLFGIRCRSNPALITRCTIQWIDSWSKEGMHAVPRLILGNTMADLPKENNNIAPVNVDQIIKYMVAIHQSVGAEYPTTPRQFVQFVNTYKKLYETKRQSGLQQQAHLQAGLAKLSEAAQSVDVLSKDAIAKKKILNEKQEQAAAALNQIEESMAQASEQRQEVEKIKSRLNEEEKVLNERNAEINQQLGAIQPVLDNAKQAVAALKPETLTEIRTFKAPPAVTQDVLVGVLLLLGKQDTSWTGVRSFLINRSAREEIMNFNSRNITPEVREAVMRHIDEHPKSFEEKTIQRASVAVAPLAAWIQANLEYSSVLFRVAPLEEEQRKLEASLQRSQQKLEKCEQTLKRLDKKVAELKQNFAKRTREAEELRLELEKAEQVLAAAQNLLGKLGGEQERWEKQVKELSASLSSFPYHSLLAAAFISYLSKTPEDVRQSFMDKWKAMMNIKHYDFMRFMSTESQMLTFKSEGLPADDLSMQNAIVILESLQCPCIIDPAQQASEWLKEHIRAAAGSNTSCLEVTNYQDPRFSNAVELAVRFGKTLIIQEVDKIEPILYPILRQELISQGPRKVVQIGDKTVDYNDNFKMFLITRSPHLALPPDARSLITEVNFTVTRSGLEGQLLGITIQHEQPLIEQQKSQLLQKEEEFKLQLAQLEKQLLDELANSSGNLLENKALIDRLNEIKQKSQVIVTSLQESHSLQKSLDEQREVYRPLAKTGSTIFFLMMDLQKVDHMYQFSLSVFIRLFKQALQENTTTATAGPNNSTPIIIEARIALLAQSLQKLALQYVSRSLFKADRLLFAMHMVRNLFPHMFQEGEWDYFMGKTTMLHTGSSIKSAPKWITSANLEQAYSLLAQAFPALVGSTHLDLANDEVWQKWFKNAQCEKEFPVNRKKVTPFQLLLVVQAFRPDRLYSAMNIFVNEALEVTSLSPPSLNLETICYKESLPEEPILLITTPGADPSQELEETAVRVMGRNKFHQLAMGQGQTDAALSLLRTCAKSGEWLCLKNLHLVISWLPVLEKELNLLQPSPGFRLWLTSETHPEFPIILLQNSLKITFEAPPGIKKNLLRTYDSWTPQYISAGTPMRAQLLFCLAWFHAVVQERRTYIPQGWTKFYEFSSADLRSAADVIDAACAGGKMPDWPTIYGLLENAIYGGRVDNENDLNVLRTYLYQYFNAEILNSIDSSGNGNSGGSAPLPMRQRLLPSASKAPLPIPMPTTAHHADYVNAINSLSDTDAPSMFGLSANADRLVQIAQSKDVIEKLKSLNVSKDAGKSFDREQWEAQLSPILQFWKKLTQANQKILFPSKSAAAATGHTTTSTTSVPSSENPLDIFVVLEKQNALSLVAYVDSCLSEIERVSRGASLLTPTIEAQAAAMLLDKVPDQWRDKWEDGPEDIKAWLSELVSKTLSLEAWVERVHSNSLLSGAPIRLGDLFNPKIFLNALRQQTARAINTPMDQLKLVSCWRPGLLDASTISITVEGLMLQGCGFDGDTLSELSPDSPILSSMPPCILAWIPHDANAPYTDKSCVNVPFYSSPSRETMLCELSLPCKTDKAKWILMGVAVVNNAV